MSLRATTPSCGRWGSNRELKRTLGFMSNFAIAFAFISVSTGSYGNFGVGIGLGGTGVLLDLADRHRRPVPGRPRLRRAGEPFPGRGLDLPVVEAPVEPDARVVHRLVLLLGPGRHGQRRGRHRRLRGLRDHGRWPGVPRLAVAHRRRQHAYLHRPHGIAAHDADQRLRRPADVDPQQHRRRHRDPGHGGLRAHPAVLREPSVAERAVRHRRRRGRDERQLRCDVRARLLHVRVHRLRLRHGGHIRRGDDRREHARRRVASFRRSSSRAPSASSSSSPSSWRSRAFPTRWPRASRASSRSRRSSPSNLDHGAGRRHHRRRDLPLRHPGVGVRLHAGHPGRRDADDVLDGP